jgi:hypothetical protein
VTRVARRAVVLALLAALVPSCRGGGTSQHDQDLVRELTALDAAITAVNGARKVVVADADRVTAAVRRLDEADAYGGRGDQAGMRRSRPAARRAVALAVPALRAIAGDAGRYTAALAVLDRAANGPGLDPTQRAAVRDVVVVARAEADRSSAFGRVALGVWPRFQAFDAAQELWLQRASNGWYRSVEESANAYVVLSHRDEVEAARRAVEQADVARAQAARNTASATARARAALAPLLATPRPS